MAMGGTGEGLGLAVAVGGGGSVDVGRTGVLVAVVDWQAVRRIRNIGTSRKSTIKDSTTFDFDDLPAMKRAGSRISMIPIITKLGQQLNCCPNFMSGDGGNRTRVRKIRPTEIYERSLPKLVTAGISAGR
jgi:hypothetical protein